MGLSQILRTAKLQVITDLSAADDFARLCNDLFNAGVDLIQVRETGLDRDQSVKVLESARQVAFDHRKMLVVGRDVELAAAYGADFLHLGASDGELPSARAKLSEFSLVGRSVHRAEELSSTGADYLFVGPVYGENVPGLGLVGEAAVAHPVVDVNSLPWFAVGGINADNLDEVLEAGAVRIAVSSAVTKAADPAAAAGALAERIGQVWRESNDLRSYVMAALGGGGALLGQPPAPPGPHDGPRAQ